MGTQGELYEAPAAWKHELYLKALESYERAGLTPMVRELSQPGPALPPVRADPDRLHQILDNLLDNAVKYAPAGSTVAVAVSVSGSAVETVVSTPAGPPPPDPERMFDRFYRADPSRST